MNFLPAAPVLIFLIGAVLTLFGHPRRRWQRLISLITCSLALAASLFLAHLNLKGLKPILAFGGWDLPLGIVYVADPLACLLLITTAIIGLGVSVYTWTTLSENDEHLHFHFFVLMLLAGVSAAFLTADLFHLFVCFELLLISSFVLMSLGSSKAQLEGSIKYVSINLIASLLFLMAVGLLYAQVGTLNLADLAKKIPVVASTGTPWIPVSGIMMLVAFGIKAAIFPLFFWLPSSYHTPPAVITALFAGLLTKVGVYALLRVFPLLYFPLGVGFEKAFLLLGALTMVIGVLGAVSETSIKRILSVHIISQVGYIVLAIGLQSPVALAAAIFYMLHNMIAKTNLFFVGGLVESLQGTDNLARSGSLFKRAPILSLSFLMSALGLAGLPPLSGFFAKFFVLYAASERRETLAMFIALAVSLLTLYSMLKIWHQVFWKSNSPEAELRLDKMLGKAKLLPAYVVTASFSILVLILGLGASTVFEWTLSASALLVEPSAYIRFVLGGG